MIDFHCHLDLFNNPIEIIKGSLDRGLYVLSVTTTPSAWVKSNELGNNNPRIKTALGLHPLLAQERENELMQFDLLVDKVKYVGEIGLDGSSEYSKTWEAQLRVFNHILNSCQNSGGKIMSIHSRKAVKQVLECLGTYPNAGTPILHWYSGSIKDLLHAVDLGCWFSVNPSMVYSKSGINVIKNIPKDKILTETDSPFTGIYGKPYNPWDIYLVINELSDIWNISTFETKSIIWQNCKNLLTQ
jgi:TatD DNase family protein